MTMDTNLARYGGGNYSFIARADGGSLRIAFDGGYIRFGNGMGDGAFNVTVTDDRAAGYEPGWKFVDSFGVYTHATISSDDTTDEKPAIVLPQGGYFVYHNKRGNGSMLIVRMGDEKRA